MYMFLCNVDGIVYILRHAGQYYSVLQRFAVVFGEWLHVTLYVGIVTKVLLITDTAFIAP